jgi:hypothetical protein
MVAWYIIFKLARLGVGVPYWWEDAGKVEGFGTGK